MSAKKILVLMGMVIILMGIGLISSRVQAKSKLSDVNASTNKINNMRMCTLAGCGPVATVFFDTPVSFDELKNSKIKFCQNSKCALITFANLNSKPRPFTGDGGKSDLEQTWGMIGADKNGKLFVKLAWNGGRGFFGRTFNADRYSVDVLDSDGNSIYDFEKWVGYKISYPNGKSCGPKCYNAAADQRQKALSWEK